MIDVWTTCVVAITRGNSTTQLLLTALNVRKRKKKYAEKEECSVARLLKLSSQFSFINRVRCKITNRGSPTIYPETNYFEKLSLLTNDKIPLYA